MSGLLECLRKWTYESAVAALLEVGRLPRDFDGWSLANRDGRTVAHEAAAYGCLPDDFTGWEWRTANGTTVAHKAAFYGHLPRGFTGWDWADAHRDTVAHAAAHSGQLPPDFTGWDWKTDNGWTVAHAAAGQGHLPPDFSDWDWRTNDGWTVAHLAAANGHLPADFNRWDVLDPTDTHHFAQLPAGIQAAARAWHATQSLRAADLAIIDTLLTQLVQLRPLVDDADGAVAQAIAAAEAHRAQDERVPDATAPAGAVKKSKGPQP